VGALGAVRGRPRAVSGRPRGLPEGPFFGALGAVRGHPRGCPLLLFVFVRGALGRCPWRGLGRCPGEAGSLSVTRFHMILFVGRLSVGCPWAVWVAVRGLSGSLSVGCPWALGRCPWGCLVVFVFLPLGALRHVFGAPSGMSVGSLGAVRGLPRGCPWAVRGLPRGWPIG
jgi:hypothetical protein